MKTVFNIYESVFDILNRVVFLIIGVALVGFLWGMVRFLFSTDPKKRTDGRQFMIHGIVTLFVMTSLWGLVFLFNSVISGDGNVIETDNPNPTGSPNIEEELQGGFEGMDYI